MRIRSIVSVLMPVVAAAALAACGSSSKSSTTSVSPTSAATTASTPGASSGGAPTGTQAAACAQVTGDLRPLTTAGNNPQQILAQARAVVPKLRATAIQQGISAQTRSAVNDLADSLQSVVNGARGSDAGAKIAAAANKLAVACR